MDLWKFFSRRRRERVTIVVSPDDPHFTNPTNKEVKTGMAIGEFIQALRNQDSARVGRASLASGSCPYFSFAFKIAEAWRVESTSFVCPHCKKLLTKIR